MSDSVSHNTVDSQRPVDNQHPIDNQRPVDNHVGNERSIGDHAEPTVTSTSDNHSANISKKQDPHSVAHESVAPESHPVGQEEHATTGPDDAPPGAAEGENYPPQKHAGKVGLGPHYAEVHGKEAGFGSKITGLKEQIKGKVTHNPELAERGHDRATGDLKAKQQAEDDAKSPFKAAGDDKSTEGTTAPPNAPNANPAEKIASREQSTQGTPATTNANPTTEKVAPH